MSSPSLEIINKCIVILFCISTIISEKHFGLPMCWGKQLFIPGFLTPNIVLVTEKMFSPGLSFTKNTQQASL